MGSPLSPQLYWKSFVFYSVCILMFYQCCVVIVRNYLHIFLDSPTFYNSYIVNMKCCILTLLTPKLTFFHMLHMLILFLHFVGNVFCHSVLKFWKAHCVLFKKSCDMNFESWNIQWRFLQQVMLMSQNYVF